MLYDIFFTSSVSHTQKSLVRDNYYQVICPKNWLNWSTKLCCICEIDQLLFISSLLFY